MCDVTATTWYLQEKIRSIHQRDQNIQGVAFAETNLALVLCRLGNLEKAVGMVEKSIQSFQDLRNQQLEKYSKLVRAEIGYALEQFEEGLFKRSRIFEKYK